MDLHLILYYIGIFYLFAAHIYMLTQKSYSQDMITWHAYFSLLASAFIAYYFMNKEGFIKF